ncbi:FlgI [Desulforapulum autotrophicum HRM2]|uniref:Flagellar P-ring protein n=1 Tax=Desulforapulum autotrophicum (strain ATCC 43914 / DSM 3382 / VKM B-1955 / HRM2) TaxID=177437 RepID=C0QA39_DESAH|nr:flagellar basal body P-ring protein FlgI [Desulforapulum autotrophicum]ACN16757.1 FlgI [Desulforapulum autotrophicum HRM2]
MMKKYMIGSTSCFVTLGIFFLTFVLFSGIKTAQGARIKDLAAIKGIRSNQLTGYGLIVGLDGTGDKSGADFTTQALANMMDRMGIHVDKDELSVKNIAAVIVTADIPAFARIGNKIDVVASSIGDAKSLSGGTLLLTPLKGVDGQVYALAQGPVTLGGVGAGGARGSTQKNHLQVARIANGASVEREIPVVLDGKKALILSLFNPDFTTAKRVADTINASIGDGVAEAVDSSALRLNIPENMQESKVAEFLADIETLSIVPDTRAKVVVNEKTGTVVIGENVTISTVAVAHGNLTVTIKKSSEVSQPESFTQGETITTSQRDVAVDEEAVKVMPLPGGATIGELVKGLNSIGVSPRDLITILQSIKAAGALQAELEII